MQATSRLVVYILCNTFVEQVRAGSMAPEKIGALRALVALSPHSAVDQIHPVYST